VSGLQADEVVKLFQRKLAEHKDYIAANGQDMPEVLNWRWTQS
jgi:xylulose-5-phosphate/fructose-6-phosphate phosphoketolase